MMLTNWNGHIEQISRKQTFQFLIYIIFNQTIYLKLVFTHEQTNWVPLENDWPHGWILSSVNYQLFFWIINADLEWAIFQGYDL